MPEPVVITEGRFAGWKSWGPVDPFEAASGPFYVKTIDGEPTTALEVEEKHLNGAGGIHGGCLMTLADNAIFSIAWKHLRGAPCVTVHLAGDFTASARAGDVLLATGEVTRAGGSLVFVRGLVKCEETIVLSFNGVIKRLRPKAPDAS